MFDNKRYLTCGVDSTIPLELQLFLWECVERIPRDYAMDIAVAAFSETVRWWLKDHSDYTPEEISRFYFESVGI